MSHDDFYRALEDRFRASREDIGQRLEGYRPFLDVLARQYATRRAFDIGCGRGEWLELLSRSGWQAQGVDLDDSMLAACHEQGLQVENKDALEALQAMPENSLELISAFHVVEHLPFEYLHKLLHEVFRVLAPGGLLILETPNSENLIVGTNNFYLDPTHQRPVPALFLDFLCQYCGFARSKILRLQEDPALHGAEAHIGVWQVLYGVSPDYAVVAQKPADARHLQPFDELFNAVYGFDLEKLAVRHDQQTQQALTQQNQRVEQLGAQLRDISRLCEEQQGAIGRLSNAIEQVAERSAQAEQELQAIYSSRSWRITRPLRVATELLRRCNRASWQARARRLVKAWLGWLRAQPRLHPLSLALLKRLPRLDRALQHYLNQLDGMIAPAPLDFSKCRTEYPPRVLQRAEHLQRWLVAQEHLQREIPRQGMPRLAYVSPLPPERTGIADYSAELLPVLAEHFAIDVIVEQAHVEDDWISTHCAIRDAAWLAAHAKEYDAVLYHVGNSQFHAWMLALLAQVPGILVLHDFYLSGLIWALEEDPEQRGIKWRELYASQGYPGLLALANAEDEGKVAFHYPFNRLLLENAQGIIVHSAASKRLAQHWYGEQVAADWIQIPHLRQPIQPIPRAQARQQLGLPEEAFILCSFGLLGVTKLNERLLSAWLASALAADPKSLLIFVGELADDDYGRALRQQIADSGLAERIRITGWADMASFRLFLSAADLAVQLRCLSRGESSGTVLDCMNYALPTIINAHGSMADLPEEAVLRLPDCFSDAELSEALERLWRDPSARQTLGARGRQIIEQQHAPAQCASLYQEAIALIQTRERSKAQVWQQQLLRMQIEPLPFLEEGQPALLALAEQLAHAQRPALSQPQLLVDITATCRHDRHTGIERVARALTLALLADPPTGMRVEPVYLSDIGGRWHYRYAQAYTARLLGVPPQVEDHGIDYAPGDQLIALDIAGETFIEASRAGLYQRLQAQGVTCRMLVHDLLPVTQPDFFPPQAHQRFSDWLQQVIALDGAICVSQTVATALQHWIALQPAKPAVFPIGYSHHGADLSHSAPSAGLPENAAATLAALAARPSVLMVGTLEPRKGYCQALEAFSLLWQQGVDVNLVIVGREGWRDLPDEQRRDIPQLMALLKAHPEQGQRLFWLDGISDEYLEQVYTAAHGLLAASWDEGFGLPLIEAAQKGLPILARDIPVFREVAAEHACYFKAGTPEQLASAVLNWLNSGFQPPSTAMPWLVWQESAAHLKHLLTR